MTETSTGRSATDIDAMLTLLAKRSNLVLVRDGEDRWILNILDVPVSIRFLPKENVLRFIVLFLEVPTSGQRKFFEYLLVKNASVPHGAYAILNHYIIFTDSLAARELDTSELFETIRAIADELQYSYAFLHKFSGEVTKDRASFEEHIQEFSFSADPDKRRETLELLLFSVGADGVRTFLQSYKELEGVPYLPDDRVEAVLTMARN